MIMATLDKFPGTLIHWGDFFQRLHEDFGEEGLSYGSVYGYMTREKIADFSTRPFRRLVFK
ncbi:MAG TPA: hypothetical protein VME66_08095 [Candidatus Acidoferrales bacterium]|nr:hypothetical protein [Candidatus Acidoferrales bacterium]